MEMIKKFQLLMYKNFVIRKKQWKKTLFVEILLMLFFVFLGKSARDLMSSATQKTVVVYPVKSKSQLIENFTAVIEHLYFAPANSFTKSLMQKAGDCLQLSKESLYNMS